MTKDITPIFKKYSTDKNDHGYAEYYQKHLPDEATRILEIGVHKGESIKMWHEIYPHAHIFGLDLFSEYDAPFQADWVTWFKGSQIDGELLKTVRLFGQFDFIVEDGSHNSRDQLMTFYGLVDCCKLYVAEDLHCAKEEFYRQGMRFESTMLGQMKLSKTPMFPNRFDLYLDKIAFIYT